MLVKAISYSSDRTLARCEQQYSYRYQENLRPRLKKEGLWRGDWIHQLLGAYYLKKDWKRLFNKIKKEKWDKLFDEEKEMYGVDFPQDIKDLMLHYVEYWSEDKDLEILDVEKKMEIVTNQGDKIRWIMDLVARDDKDVVFFENKAKKKIPDSSERILQPQVHSYAYLYWKKTGVKINKVIWNYIRTSPVPRPKILKDGSLSVREINTDQRSYLRSLKEAGIHPKNDQERIGIENKLKSLPETLTLERVTNTIRLDVGEQYVRDWVERARRAKLTKRPLRNWNRMCKTDCDFYNLCQVDMLGQTDRDLVIKKDFTVKEFDEVK